MALFIAVVRLSFIAVHNQAKAKEEALEEAKSEADASRKSMKKQKERAEEKEGKKKGNKSKRKSMNEGSQGKKNLSDNETETVVSIRDPNKNGEKVSEEKTKKENTTKRET